MLGLMFVDFLVFLSLSIFWMCYHVLSPFMIEISLLWGYTSFARICGFQAWPIALHLAEDGATRKELQVAQSSMLQDVLLAARMKDFEKLLPEPLQIEMIRNVLETLIQFLFMGYRNFIFQWLLNGVVQWSDTRHQNRSNSGKIPSHSSERLKIRRRTETKRWQGLKQKDRHTPLAMSMKSLQPPLSLPEVQRWKTLDKIVRGTSHIN